MPQGMPAASVSYMISKYISCQFLATLMHSNVFNARLMLSMLMFGSHKLSGRKLGLRIRSIRKNWTFSQLVHRPKPPGQGRVGHVNHKSAITDHAVEENHVIDWDKEGKSGRQKGTATDQMDKRCILD